MGIFPDRTSNLATAVLDACVTRRWHIATAESCTGGLVASALTEIAGSSRVVDRGFVTYDNEAKMEMLGVSQTSLDSYGAVSESVAREMALGALRRSTVQLTVAITGIAGPGGATPTKPVGLVHFAACVREERPIARHQVFEGDRSKVRLKSVDKALEMLLELASQ